MARTYTVITHAADGTVTEEVHTMSAELEAILADARAEEERLVAAGTPYWCHCEGVDFVAALDTGEAYWKDDEYEAGQGDGIHRKHGVMHAPCGGYLQEG